MKALIYCILFLTIAGCQSQQAQLVKYKYLEMLISDYKFNAEIDYYFQQGKDVGLAATNYSFTSEHQNLINTLVSSDTTKMIGAEMLLEIEKNYTPVNASSYILNKSKEHDFLLINEAHFIPQHRNFLSQLLPGLAQQGYCNLALEGLNNSKDIEKAISTNGYPEIFHGHYLKDPEYANLIRKAHELGFNIFGYDGGSGEDREITGANNILEKIKSFDKKGKTIVLCGWDHIKEGPTGTYWEYALAGRIKEYSGKDPLTINQTQYYERAERIYEDSLYQAMNFTEPTILIDQQNESLDLEANKDWYDVFVFLPRTKFTDAVPDWILKEKALKEFKLPEIDITYPCKVLIFEKEDEIQMAVPIYMLELTQKQKSIKAPVFKKKEYKVLIANKQKAYLVE